MGIHIPRKIFTKYTVRCRYHGPIWHDSAYISAVTEAEYESQFEPTKYIPYLALTGELWNVFCEDLGKNWLRYNGTALYWNEAQNPV